MKKIDLIDLISKEINITRSESRKSVEIVIDEISMAIISGNGVEVRGFGGFKRRYRKGRIGVNPKSGQKTIVSEKFVPFFKPGKFLKDEVNKG